VFELTCYVEWKEILVKISKKSSTAFKKKKKNEKDGKKHFYKIKN